jgi:multicomponent Na+:H+ antiporter subunit F
MNAWLVAALALLVPLAACGWACRTRTLADRIVALMLAGEIATLVLLLLAAGYHRDFYVDCALAAAILPYPSSIVYAHFFERWL